MSQPPEGLEYTHDGRPDGHQEKTRPETEDQREDQLGADQRVQVKDENGIAILEIDAI